MQSAKSDTKILQVLPRILFSIACVLFMSNLASANPIVIYEPDDPVFLFPFTIWGVVVFLLFLEASFVAWYLRFREYKLLPAFISLLLLNLTLFVLFAKWLIVESFFSFNVPLSALYAEAAIVLIEAIFIFLMCRIKAFKKNNSKPLFYVEVFFISLLANTGSAMLGVMMIS